MTPDELRGQTVHIGAGCGVQFASGRDLTMRVTRGVDSKSWDGMAWITGYVLDPAGQAVERREVYVIVAGLTIVTPAPAPARRPARNSRPMVPRPRTPSDTTVTTAGRTR